MRMTTTTMMRMMRRTRKVGSTVTIPTPHVLLPSVQQGLCWQPAQAYVLDLFCMYTQPFKPLG